MTILFIFTNCRDTWFDDSRALKHLTFQKQVFLTFENFPLSHKMYLENYNTLDVCGKGTIVFNLPKIFLKAIKH
jgi:hypothetical protein